MDLITRLGPEGLILVVAGCLAVALLVVTRLASLLLWREAVDKPNAATRLVQAGETLGVFLVAGSAAHGCVHGDQLRSEIFWAGVFGFFGAILLIATGRLGTGLLLGKSLREEVRSGNQAAAIACAGHYIATAIIIARCLYGNDLATLGVSLAFFAIGQITLHGCVLLFRALTSYDDAEEIKGENVAAGLSYAGATVALAMIIGHAAEGTFTGWSSSLKAYGAALLFSLALWPVRQLLVQTIVVGGRPTLWKGKLDEGIARERNAGLGALEAVSYLATALIVTWLS
ncbi:MAG: DUF350 domain-containing protein [Deltaproteobacteria bacterium]|nr:DUF350 domain-containing protein [Deltaproteobacteria bacterium]